MRGEDWENHGIFETQNRPKLTFPKEFNSKITGKILGFYKPQFITVHIKKRLTVEIQ